jgi:hypothetical protein
MEEHGMKPTTNDDDDKDVEYDEYGNPLYSWKKVHTYTHTHTRA